MGKRRKEKRVQVHISDKVGQTWLSAFAPSATDYDVELDIKPESEPYLEAILYFHGGENANFTAEELVMSWRAYWATKDAEAGRPTPYDEVDFYLKHSRTIGAYGEDRCPYCLGETSPDQNLLVWPCRDEIHEWAIMDRFAQAVEDERIGQELRRALRKKGAFRRFKDAVHRRNLAEDWYAYKAQALRQIARAWCEENDIPFAE